MTLENKNLWIGGEMILVHNVKVCEQSSFLSDIKPPRLLTFEQF